MSPGFRGPPTPAEPRRGGTFARNASSLVPPLRGSVHCGSARYPGLTPRATLYRPCRASVAIRFVGLRTRIASISPARRARHDLLLLRRQSVFPQGDQGRHCTRSSVYAPSYVRGPAVTCSSVSPYRPTSTSRRCWASSYSLSPRPIARPSGSSTCRAALRVSHVFHPRANRRVSNSYSVLVAKDAVERPGQRGK